MLCRPIMFCGRVPSLNGVFFACRNLVTSCFVDLDCRRALIAQPHSVLLFHYREWNSFSGQISLSFQGLNSVSALLARITPYPQYWHSELCANHWLFFPLSRRCLSWKKCNDFFFEKLHIGAGVPFLSRKYFEMRQLAASFFVELWDCHQALITLCHYVLLSCDSESHSKNVLLYGQA